MKAFITGINGFVGVYLAEHLLASGDDVFGSALEPRWRQDAPRALVENCRISPWDIGSAPSTAFRDELAAFAPDWIFHLAAISAPADCGSTEPSEAAARINIEGAKHVVELAAALPKRPRIVLASSCKVYAPIDPAAPIVDENAPLGPAGGYGKTKLAAEQLMREAGQEHGLEFVIVRAFQHTGPRQEPRYMLPEWAAQLARGENPIRAHCLNSYIDVSDVRDVVRAYRLLADGGAAGQAYNVGSGVQRRSGDILNRLLELGEADCQVEEISPRPQHHPIADFSRLSAELRWRPTIDLDATLRDTLRYWRREVSQ